MTVALCPYMTVRPGKRSFPSSKTLALATQKRGHVTFAATLGSAAFLPSLSVGGSVTSHEVGANATHVLLYP